MAYRTCLIIGIKRKIPLHSLRRENFFQKLLGQFHKTSYLCTAVPVVPLPDIQVLVMNPGFLCPFVCWLQSYKTILTLQHKVSQKDIIIAEKRPPRRTTYNIIMYREEKENCLIANDELPNLVGRLGNFRFEGINTRSKGFI